MENFENNTPVESSVLRNMKINEYLFEAAKWGKFLAIVGYVMMGLLVVLAFVMMFGVSLLSKAAGSGFPMMMIGMVYLVLAGVYFIPVTYLYKFSVQMKQAVESQDEGLYTSSFENLKSLFKFMGIFTIVMLSLYALALLIAVPMAMLFK
ncbi:MAG: hypothetical protein JZU47_20940 [Prolixibacteraceae bacterium]|nr:hypothetical protein [Prolixibacteraceae bacterium]